MTTPKTRRTPAKKAAAAPAPAPEVVDGATPEPTPAAAEPEVPAELAAAPEAVSEADPDAQATLEVPIENVNEAVTSPPTYPGVPALDDGSSPDEAYTVKGNADSNRYHEAGGPYYDRTDAEVWFKTVADAEAAGFTPAPAEPDKVLPAGAQIDPPAAPPAMPTNEAHEPPPAAAIGIVAAAQSPTGSYIIDAATKHMPDPETVFEKVTETGSALRCVRRLIEVVPQGEGVSPLRRLVIAPGSEVAPDRAEHLLRILRNQVEPADEDTTTE